MNLKKIDENSHKFSNFLRFVNVKANNFKLNCNLNEKIQGNNYLNCFCLVLKFNAILFALHKMDTYINANEYLTLFKIIMMMIIIIIM